MSAREPIDPIWDRELDGAPPRAGGRVSPGLVATAYLRAGGTPPGRKPVSVFYRMWSNRHSVGFTLAAGVLAPIGCLVADPCVFKGGDEHGGMLKEQRIFFYTFIGLETLVLTLWLLGRERLERIGGVIAGALLTGAWVAATIGLFLVPLSMVGLLLLLIGTLGFTPWLTAYVYLHHGRVALRAATVRGRFGYVATSFVFGAALALGVPLGVHLGVERAWENAISDVAAGDTSANARVRFFYRFVDTGGVDCPLDAAVDAERDPLRKERLAELRQHW